MVKIKTARKPPKCHVFYFPERNNYYSLAKSAVPKRNLLQSVGDTDVMHWEGEYWTAQCVCIDEEQVADDLIEDLVNGTKTHESLGLPKIEYSAEREAEKARLNARVGKNGKASAKKNAKKTKKSTGARGSAPIIKKKLAPRAGIARKKAIRSQGQPAAPSLVKNQEKKGRKPPTNRTPIDPRSSMRNVKIVRPVLAQPPAQLPSPVLVPPAVSVAVVHSSQNLPQNVRPIPVVVPPPVSSGSHSSQNLPQIVRAVSAPPAVSTVAHSSMNHAQNVHPVPAVVVPPAVPTAAPSSTNHAQIVRQISISAPRAELKRRRDRDEKRPRILETTRYEQLRDSQIKAILCNDYRPSPRWLNMQPHYLVQKVGSDLSEADWYHYSDFIDGYKGVEFDRMEQVWLYNDGRRTKSGLDTAYEIEVRDGDKSVMILRTRRNIDLDTAEDVKYKPELGGADIPEDDEVNMVVREFKRAGKKFMRCLMYGDSGLTFIMESTEVVLRYPEQMKEWQEFGQYSSGRYEDEVVPLYRRWDPKRGERDEKHRLTRGHPFHRIDDEEREEKDYDSYYDGEEYEDEEDEEENEDTDDKMENEATDDEAEDLGFEAEEEEEEEEEEHPPFEVKDDLAEAVVGWFEREQTRKTEEWWLAKKKAWAEEDDDDDIDVVGLD